MTPMHTQAQHILRQNCRGTYTVPTPGLYPYQWNWDSAFAAWGFSTFDIVRGWDELHCLFSGQWENGMVPHILFHRQDDGYFPGPDEWGTRSHTQTSGVASSGISQPPLAASFALQMYNKDRKVGIKALRTLFDKMKHWHRWFYRYRCDEGVVAIVHPWESGRDNAPDWDGAVANVDTDNVGAYTRRDTVHVDASMRPTKIDYDRFVAIVYTARDLQWHAADIRHKGQFWVGDPTITFILLRANRDLLKIATILDKDSTEIEEIEQWIAHMERGVHRLWCADKKTYCAFDFRTRTHSGVVSSASFLCWYAGLDNPHMMQHLQRLLSTSPYGVPSCDPDHSSFDAMRYWRGPVWAIMNVLIGMGLEDMGYVHIANSIRDMTRRLISRHGFAEYYDCNTGTPAGGQDFTWTAAAWLAWASPEQAQHLQGEWV